MILVLRALGVGDLATGVPALRALRAAFPGRTLALAAPAWLAPLVELIGGVDRLIPVGDPVGEVREPCVGASAPGGFPEPVRLAVNLHGRGPQSHRWLRAAGADSLWAYRCPAAGHRSGPDWIDEEHEVRRWCRLLWWHGFDADPADLTLRRPTSDQVPVGVSVVHPGGKGNRRRWSPQRFAELATQLQRSGHRVVVTGAVAERALASRVASGAGLAAPAVLAGRLDLMEMAALVAHARVVVSTDTGIAHLATAYRTPSVVLFGPVSPRQWGPPDRPWHRAIWSPPEAGGPDDSADPWLPGPGMHPSLAAITVARVRAAVDAVDETWPARRGGGWQVNGGRPDAVAAK